MFMGMGIGLLMPQVTLVPPSASASCTQASAFDSQGSRKVSRLSTRSLGVMDLNSSWPVPTWSLPSHFEMAPTVPSAPVRSSFMFGSSFIQGDQAERFSKVATSLKTTSRGAAITMDRSTNISLGAIRERMRPMPSKASRVIPPIFKAFISCFCLFKKYGEFYR